MSQRIFWSRISAQSMISRNIGIDLQLFNKISFSAEYFQNTGKDILLVVQIPGTTQQVSIPKSDIQSRVRSERSSMPEGLLNLLNGQQRRDLFLLLEAGPGAIPDSALARLGVSR